MKYFFIPFILILTTSPIAHAFVVQDAAEAPKQMIALEAKAEAGDVAAQKELAALYFKNGRRITDDYRNAFKWYGRAAESGDLEAMDNLGMLYEKGKGVKTSLGTAIDIYTKAAEQGYAPSQYHLGMIYYHWRLGGQYHYADSIKWLTAAGNQDHKLAQYHLGQAYIYGKKAPRSMQKAIEWHTRAAALGHIDSQVRMAEILNANRKYDQAIKYTMMAAEQNDTMALVRLAEAYRDGKGVPSDFDKAVEWFTKAAVKGHSSALLNIADMYSRKQDYIMARTYVVIASGLSYRPAMQQHESFVNRLSPAENTQILNNVRQWLELHPSRKSSKLKEWLKTE